MNKKIGKHMKTLLFRECLLQLVIVKVQTLIKQLAKNLPSKL